MSSTDVLTWLAVLASGLTAGLFYGWSVSVMPGTRQVDDKTYISTMQSINVAIVNPLFLIPFMLTPVICGVAALLKFGEDDAGAWWLVIAAAVYLVGVLGVTIAGNIPLNNRLDAFDLDKSEAADIANERGSYESGWNRWHYVRTVANVAAFACAVIAAI